MGRLWDDRLVEVWAEPGKVGSGILVGDKAVFTARHVVAGALDGGKVLARVVRPGLPVDRWSRMEIHWEDAAWDMALLTPDFSCDDSEEYPAWLPPRSPSPVVVRLGTSAEPDCEAVGFPDAEKQTGGGGLPGKTRRQPEQAVGILLPTGQGKPPISPERLLPKRWMPLDVDTSRPDSTAGWKGISGAGVVLPDGRLVGLVVGADPGHQHSRVYVVPLAEVLQQVCNLGAILAAVNGELLAVQGRDAHAYAEALHQQCLGADGLPRLVGEFDSLGAFGVKPADLPGEPLYLDYVIRDDDDRLRELLKRADRERKVLLVVGPSGAGKSRSAAEAVRDHFPDHRFVWALEDTLPQLVRLPVLNSERVLVWLDEIQQQTGPGRLRVWLRKLLDAGAIVVGTIRRAELELLTQPGEVRNPAGEALSDHDLVLRVDWRLEWSPAERKRGKLSLNNPGARQALSQGFPLGVWCVAGPQLLKRFDDAAMDEEWPFRHLLVRSVLDWYRTGVGLPIPMGGAVVLAALAGHYGTLPDSYEIDDALQWALQAVTGGGRRTRQSLLSMQPGKSLTVHDYLLDRAQSSSAADVMEEIWTAALECVEGARRFDIGTIALHAGNRDVAIRAYRPLVETGDVNAMTNLGTLLADDQPEEAEQLYRQAAEKGDSYAMFNMGVLLEKEGSQESQRWYERAAQAGLTRAMFNLGVLLQAENPAQSRHWYEQAAEAGDPDAMVNLGNLLRWDDTEAARHWYQKSADTGHVDAIYSMGLLLSKDAPQEAQRWYKRAADLGDADAMADLAMMLAESDPAAARQWQVKSAEAGSPRGMANLGASLLADDPEAARSWCERAAAAGNTGGMYNLGVILAASDPEESRRWFESAAEAGHTAAMYNLGVMLTPYDPQLARSWYERAIEADPSDELYQYAILARLNLGMLLADVDRELALRYLRQAADAGLADAMANLGTLLSQSDPQQARLWLEKSASLGCISAMNSLGLLLSEKEPEVARFWLIKAAENGDFVVTWNYFQILRKDDPAKADTWLESMSDRFRDQ